MWLKYIHLRTHIHTWTQVSQVKSEKDQCVVPMSVYWLSHTLVLQNSSAGINWVQCTWDRSRSTISCKRTWIYDYFNKNRNKQNADVTPWEHHGVSSATGADSCWSLNSSGDEDEGRPQKTRTTVWSMAVLGVGTERKGLLCLDPPWTLVSSTAAHPEVTGTNAWPNEEKRLTLLAAPIVSAG